MASELSEGLASAFLAGGWSSDALEARAQEALAARPRWLRGLCRRVLEAFPRPPAEVRTLALWLDADARLAVVREPPRRPVRVRRWFLPEPRMAPPAFAGGLEVPEIATLGDLAALLSIRPAELAWFADVTHRNRARSGEPLRHYRWRWVRKRSGGYRLLETPKPRIKQIQRVVLAHVLSRIPVDERAHGFVPGRSVLGFVAPHVAQHVVVRADLEDFFAAVTIARVRALFLALGYPYAVASALAGLCCVPTPEFVLRDNPETNAAERYAAAQRLRIPHLPQGAPTSPALSNLIAFRLDRRLAGLARAAGARYSRYADDLAFSGDAAFARSTRALIARVDAIVQEEGFRLRLRKVRVMRRGGRQRLAGLIVNARPNLPRREYDALRATLHNAARHGPSSQNRAGHPDFRAHLEGRIAWVAQTHPGRAARLRALFAHIAWDGEP